MINLSGLPRPLLLLAHSQSQVEALCQTHQLATTEIHRVLNDRDLRGYSRSKTLLLLPAWDSNQESWTAFRYWDQLGATILKLSESEVMGKSIRRRGSRPPDQQGDHHHSARQMGDHDQ